MNNEEKIIEVMDDSTNIEEKVIDETNEDILATPVKKIKKHLKAKKLVDEAKNIVAESDMQMQECKLLLEDDLREYKNSQESLKNGGLDDAKLILFNLNQFKSKDESLEESVVFETKKDVKPIVIKDVSSGRFTGSILSLLAGLGTLMGLVYIATEKLGLTLDITKVPTSETMKKIAEWFSSLVGIEGNMMLGIGLLSLLTLLVMFIVYAIRVGLKGVSNLHFANSQMLKTEKYIAHKTNCKIEMDRVDAHITDTVKTLKDYEVLLYEQNAKLKRVLHFEGSHHNMDDYQVKSKEEIVIAKGLIDNIERFMSTPMSEDGKLSGKSTLYLHSAKEILQKALARLD